VRGAPDGRFYAFQRRPVPARDPAQHGNIIRLCANTGARLHLIKPLGFWLDAKPCGVPVRLPRAGRSAEHASLQACSSKASGSRAGSLLTTRGNRRHDEVDSCCASARVFGPDTRGLPDDVLELCRGAARAHSDARGARSPEPLDAVAGRRVARRGVASQDGRRPGMSRCAAVAQVACGRQPSSRPRATSRRRAPARTRLDRMPQSKRTVMSHTTRQSTSATSASGQSQHEQQQHSRNFTIAPVPSLHLPQMARTVLHR